MTYDDGTRRVKLADLYTIEQAAEYLGISVRLVRDHLYRVGDLKADERIGGKRSLLLFRRGTLDEFRSKRNGRGLA